MRKVIAVISKTNDECSLCNRAFEDTNEAWNYLLEVEKNVGCEMFMRGLEVIRKGQDPYKRNEEKETNDV